ncbi:MAG: hypothetical protein OXR64_14255 [Chloroflexota bacterium]|nr:hypothetical protein [Chloroflexota bacterium]MDE2920994.1 hypothetical protein [Chloroflexota bacterium]
MHNVHVWTIVSGNEALTAHVIPDPGFLCDLSLLVSRGPQFLRRLQRVRLEMRHAVGLMVNGPRGR